MKFTVGGESFDLTKEQVFAAVQGVRAEPIREHLVEIDTSVFPPKQVFAAVTGRGRQTFTTMEAQRVLSRLGFVCRRVGWLDDASEPPVVDDQPAAKPSPDARIAYLESALGTVQAAIAGLHTRVRDLEAAR